MRRRGGGELKLLLRSGSQPGLAVCEFRPISARYQAMGNLESDAANRSPLSVCVSLSVSLSVCVCVSLSLSLSLISYVSSTYQRKPLALRRRQGCILKIRRCKRWGASNVAR